MNIAQTDTLFYSKYETKFCPIVQVAIKGYLLSQSNYNRHIKIMHLIIQSV